MQLEFDAENITGSCGISILFSFGNEWGFKQDLVDKEFLGGAGWTSAGFIDTPICKEYYEAFKKHLQIVYQTPVRNNENSGNGFIFVIYDGRVPLKDINNSNFEYPWSGNVNA